MTFYSEWTHAAHIVGLCGRSAGSDMWTESFESTCAKFDLPRILVKRQVDIFDVDKFTDYVTSNGFRVVQGIVRNSTKLYNDNILYASEDALIVVKSKSSQNDDYYERKKFTLVAYFNNHIQAHKFAEDIKEFIVKGKDYTAVNLLVVEDGCISTVPLNNYQTEALINDNYAPNVVAGFENICKTIKSKSPAGRLHLIDGPPGSGKTRMVSSIVHDTEASYIIVPATSAPELTTPSFMSFLAGHAEQQTVPTVLIIEDGDNMVTSRKKGGHGDMVATILNICDGPISVGLNLHVIVTFNTVMRDIDEAVKRPGRLGTHVYVPKLSLEQASKVMARLKNSEVIELEEREYTLAELYATSVGAKNNFVPNKKEELYGSYN